MKKKNKIATVALILLSCNMATAQTPITLQASIDTALKNNLQVKNEKLLAEYRKLMISSSAVVPQANVLADIGQINSIYTDTRFGVSQSFSFPKVYAVQKEMLTKEWESSSLQIVIKEADLRKQVTSVFYQLINLQQKEKLLSYADSIYTSFYQLADLRLKKGESNILEKVTAETQLGQIHLQQKQLKNDKDLLQLQFQLLLNSITVFIAEANEVKLIYHPTPGELSQHPSLVFLKHQQQVAGSLIKVEKSKLLPDITMGIYSSSITGTGADNKNYSSSKRFQSVQLGIGIPVFAKAQKAKINSAKFGMLITENNYVLGMQMLQTEFQSALAQYEKFREAVFYFEHTGLQNADLIIVTANKQFNSGLINYLEWFMLINQAASIKNDYLDAVKNLNESIIRLNYYNNK